MSVAAKNGQLRSSHTTQRNGRLTRLLVILSHNGNRTVPPTPRPARHLAQLKLGTPPRDDVRARLAAQQRLKVVQKVLGEGSRGLSRTRSDEDLGLERGGGVGRRGFGLGGEEGCERTEVDAHVAGFGVDFDLGGTRAGVAVFF